MGELRAYALSVAELRAAAGSTGVRRERFRRLVADRLAPPPAPLRERLGPLYRRVPGARLLTPDDPTPDDLDRLLDGGPVAPERATATWRLVEALASGLAVDATKVSPGDLPARRLAPLDLPVPPVDGLVAGWLPLAEARAFEAVRGWAAALPSGVDVVLLGTVGGGP